MNTEAEFLGEMSPLLTEQHGRRPDRRQISKRWLASSVLVGLTSLFLMGGALLATLDGREQLAQPASALERIPDEQRGSRIARKGNHPGLVRPSDGEDTNVMMVSTVFREDGKDVVKVKPFYRFTVPLALAPAASGRYPAFNPLAVFSESGNTRIIAKSSATMYGAEVESEVTLDVVDFPVSEISKDIKPRQRSIEIERQVRELAVNLKEENLSVSALAYFDTERFSFKQKPLLGPSEIKITAENVSVLHQYDAEEYPGIQYQERRIEVRADLPISQIFQTEGVDPAEAGLVETVLASDLGTAQLREGDTVLAHFEIDGRIPERNSKIVAGASVFRGSAHLVSIARAGKDRFVYAVQPEKTKEIAEDQLSRPAIPVSALPSTYDAIYRGALANGLDVDLASALIRILAFDVDFKSRIGLEDELEVFVSLEDGKIAPSSESEILYAGLTLNNNKRRYYRFRDADTGEVDYYDETGKSAKKFLLRKPVPNGKFRSPFGMRRHPISGRYKLHGGVDWAAPRGTPILASGNAVVKKAGWSGTGYGKQIILRHANGYETSYSHLTAVAKGIRPGIRVRQGKVIGYVGSTGYSTGPHLHYEVKVNGNRVDPMRIRLPKGKVLKDSELAQFVSERDRIDALLNQGEETQLASN